MVTVTSPVKVRAIPYGNPQRQPGDIGDKIVLLASYFPKKLWNLIYTSKAKLFVTKQLEDIRYLSP